MKEYWDKAISFDEYIGTAKNRLENPKTLQDTEYKAYYDLGIQRMERTLKKLNFDEVLFEVLDDKNFTGKILIISETWCGDASATVPAVVRFFEGKNEVKIFLRDSDESLIDQFQTNGTRSIPKILILDENFEINNTWGPRPKYGHELLLKHKGDPENYTKDMFYNELQIYYSRNRGKDAVAEILDLI
ncbi:thioredoxin [Chryseobacterium sp. Leaf180]|uniref:thioredoxin family protein n=1 Tax=Chryseobacterium sp. Leaf180 TaxID=1736289 RepID=UPI0006F33E07|nr:thioredoxin family protein [Chryseobacterium sp. Leaf180]KQR91929.1 thioredoxin [Chryseobacterium sp. Leaf180]